MATIKPRPKRPQPEPASDLDEDDLTNTQAERAALLDEDDRTLDGEPATVSELVNAELDRLLPLVLSRSCRTVNSFGVELASDGKPVFAEGLSRRQWLEAHKDERKQSIIDELRSTEPEGHG